MGGLSDSSSLIIADVGVKRSDKHKGLVEQAIDVVSVGLDTLHAILLEAITSVTKESHRVENIADYEGLEYI